jgi:hypothetical protein
VREKSTQWTQVNQSVNPHLKHNNRISSQQYGHKYTKDTNLNANNCRAKPAPRLLASMMCKEMMCKETMCKEMMCKETMWKEMICKEMMCKETMWKEMMWKEMMWKEMMWKEMMWREQNNTETYEYSTLC